MRPRQSFWKWLLAVLVAVVAVGLVFFLLRPAGSSSELRSRVETSLSNWTGGSVALLEPLSIRYLPPSIEGGFSLKNADKLPSVQSVTAPRFRLTLSLPELLLGNISFSALRLDRPTLTLKPGAEPRSVETILGKLTAFLAGAPLESVRIHRGTVEPSVGPSILKKLDLRLNTRAQLGVLHAMGSFSFNGENVTFSLDRGKTTEGDDGESAPLTLKVTSKPLTARFTGTMRTGEELAGEGDLEATLPDIRAFLAWVGVLLPEGDSFKNAQAKGQVHWTGATLTFDDGKFDFDGNQAVGLLAVTATSRPRIDGTLDFETLSLDPYLSGETPVQDGTPFLDWVLLKHLDADLRISAGELSVGGLKLGGGGFTVNAKRGIVSSEIGSLELCDGHAEGRFDLNLSQPRVEGALTGSLANVALDKCRQSLGLSVPVEGTGTVRVDLSTGGTTHDELIRGLAGTVVVTAQDGSLPIDMMALLSEPDAKASGWSEEEDTAFSQLDADCSLSAGHLWCQSFRMESGDKLVSGAGGLDIADQTLNWDFRMTDPEAGLDTSEVVSGTQPGIAIDGSLMAPLMTHAGSPVPKAADPDQEAE